MTWLLKLIHRPCEKFHTGIIFSPYPSSDGSAHPFMNEMHTKLANVTAQLSWHHWCLHCVLLAFQAFHSLINLLLQTAKRSASLRTWASIIFFSFIMSKMRQIYSLSFHCAQTHTSTQRPLWELLQHWFHCKYNTYTCVTCIHAYYTQTHFQCNWEEAGGEENSSEAFNGWCDSE